MDNIINYIHQNPVITVVIAAALMFLAGLAMRRLKIIAVIFIIIAAFAFYTLLRNDKAGKIKIDEIKKKAKDQVMDTINK